MTFGYGLILGIFGILITVVGMMIAYIVAWDTVKPKPKRKPNPVDDLFKADKMPDDVL